MKKGDKIYCISWEGYETHITKRNLYEVFKIGEGSKEGKLRIKNNQEKLVLITELCFTSQPIPEIQTISIDDEITDESNFCVEVTIKFINGTKFWTTFMTTEYLENLLTYNRRHITGERLIFTKKLNQTIINDTIHELDRINGLTNLLNTY